MLYLGSVNGSVGTTIAGFKLSGGSGFSELLRPTTVFVDPDGIMYILDAGNFRIVKWLPNQPLGTTIAGGRGSVAGLKYIKGHPHYIIDSLDKIGQSLAFFVDPQSNIYVSEFANHRISKWLNGNTTIGFLVSLFSFSLHFFMSFSV